ncbi:hypothetical protein U9M48_026872 [Paspalum notatum var. saurae]|uniref:Uncharacterized protein n=1 Tax=Paspalum notatum var. saurae TaxID=547442 RepID=A0AAQ3WZL0_PASNO
MRFSFPVTTLHPGTGSPRPARLRTRATAPPRLPISRHPGATSARPHPNPSLAPARFATPHSSSGAGAPLCAPLHSTSGAALPQRTSASSPVWLQRRAAPPHEWRIGMGLTAGGSAVSVPGASPPRLVVALCPALPATSPSPCPAPPLEHPRLAASRARAWPAVEAFEEPDLVVGGGAERGRWLQASWSWHGRIWRWGRMLPAVVLVAVGERQLPAMSSHSATTVAAAAACGVLGRWMRGGPARPFPGWRAWHSGADAASSSWSSAVWLLPPGLRSSSHHNAKLNQGTCIGVNSRCLLLELGYLLDFQLYYL